MVEGENFGATKDGREVSLFRLTNKGGGYAEVLDWGGRLRTLAVPDKSGRLTDVVLGYDTLAEYEVDEAYQGAFIGRTANRIRGAAFELNGQTWRLPANDGPHHLHGGPDGFHSRLFKASTSAPDAVTLTLRSEDGDGGYPGRLDLRLTYFFDDQNRLTIDAEARSEADTPVSLTGHAYFNLGGPESGDILGHYLAIPAQEFLEGGPDLLPTGQCLKTAGTPFDFTVPKPIGRDISANHPQLKNGGGYDHYFILPQGDGLGRAAEAWSEATGIQMTVTTNQPGLQFYSGNFLSGQPGKGGRPLGFRQGFCLEPHLWPDALNCPSFPSPVLKPGRIYNHITSYFFSIQK
jgi:aldose 1-epimerase